MEMGMVVRIIIGIGKDEAPRNAAAAVAAMAAAHQFSRTMHYCKTVFRWRGEWVGRRGAARRTPCLVLANQTKNFQGAAEHESCFYGQIKQCNTVQLCDPRFRLRNAPLCRFQDAEGKREQFCSTKAAVIGSSYSYEAIAIAAVFSSIEFIG